MDSFVEYVVDQLRQLGTVEAKAMFGGHGLYREGVFFAIIADGRLYLKTDAASRRDYEGRGMGAFRPNPKQTLKTYYEVPVEVLEDEEELSSWA
ncbi:MAG: TfoX/Sxy family protein, partial [Gemmatimonadales bacterium]